MKAKMLGDKVLIRRAAGNEVHILCSLVDE